MDENVVFWLKFHWSLFIRVQLTITQHWFRLWLGAVQATSHYLNQCWHWSIYAAPAVERFIRGLQRFTDDKLNTVTRLPLMTYKSFNAEFSILCVLPLHPGLILGLHPANKRRRYFVTTSLIGWAQAWNQPCASLQVVKGIIDLQYQCVSHSR